MPLFFYAGLALLFGCAGEPPLPATAEIFRFEAELSEAERADELSLLAPLAFQRAQLAVRNARDVLRGDGDPQEAMAELGTGRKALENAQRQAARAHERLRPILDARAEALRTGVSERRPQALAETDARLRALSKRLEKNPEMVVPVVPLAQAYTRLAKPSAAPKRRATIAAPAAPISPTPAPQRVNWREVALALFAALGAFGLGFAFGRKAPAETRPAPALSPNRRAA